MLKNFKKILGIEGVKIDISIDEIQSHPFLLSGFLHFTTFQPNVISSFSIKLVEEYSLGRGKSFKNVEYNLGEKSYNEAIILDANSHHTTIVLVLIPIFNLFSFSIIIFFFY